MDTDRYREQIAVSARTIESLGDHLDSIGQVCDLVVNALKQRCKVLTAGNGGSAAEALHMAEELVGRFRGNRASLPGICLCADPTAITCISNDYGYDHVFSRQVEGLGRSGDVLVLFSTSGNAENLRLAVEQARSAGLKTIAFLGRDGGHVAGTVDQEIIVSGDITERIQEAHQVLLHIVLDSVENAFPE